MRTSPVSETCWRSTRGSQCGVTKLSHTHPTAPGATRPSLSTPSKIYSYLLPLVFPILLPLFFISSPLLYFSLLQHLGQQLIIRNPAYFVDQAHRPFLIAPLSIKRLRLCSCLPFLPALSADFRASAQSQNLFILPEPRDWNKSTNYQCVLQGILVTFHYWLFKFWIHEPFFDHVSLFFFFLFF